MASKPSVPTVVAPTAKRRLPSSGCVAKLSRIFISCVPMRCASNATLRPADQRIQIVVNQGMQRRSDTAFRRGRNEQRADRTAQFAFQQAAEIRGPRSQTGQTHGRDSLSPRILIVGGYRVNFVEQ